MAPYQFNKIFCSRCQDLCHPCDEGLTCKCEPAIKIDGIHPDYWIPCTVSVNFKSLPDSYFEKFFK